MDFLFGKKEEQHQSSSKPKGKTILVIDSSTKRNWYEIFAGCEGPDGLPLIVEQAAWNDIHATAYSHGKVSVDIRPAYRPIPKTPQDRVRFCSPDIVLIRNGPLELEANFTNLIFAFQYAQIPAVNSLHSIFNCLHRPWVFAQLIAIRNKLGADKFPLIEQIMYSDYKEMMATPKFPIVLKVGHAHGGYGKVKVGHHHDFEDLRGLVALHKEDYSTTEPFLEGVYDLRIQKIGNHYRVFKRTTVSGAWKTNTGSSVIEQIPLTPQYKLWADECSQIFGGMDILAVDALHTKDGKELILEVNDTAIGLAPEFDTEDSNRIRDLVLEKLKSHYPSTTQQKK